MPNGSSTIWTPSSRDVHQSKCRAWPIFPPALWFLGKSNKYLTRKCNWSKQNWALEHFRKHKVWQILLFIRQLSSKRQTRGEAHIQATTAWQSSCRCFFSKLDALSLWKGHIVEGAEWERWSPALPCAVRLAGWGEVAAMMVRPEVPKMLKRRSE